MISETAQAATGRVATVDPAPSVPEAPIPVAGRVHGMAASMMGARRAALLAASAMILGGAGPVAATPLSGADSGTEAGRGRLLAQLDASGPAGRPEDPPPIRPAVVGPGSAAP